jgi:hypothetical protein
MLCREQEDRITAKIAVGKTPSIKDAEMLDFYKTYYDDRQLQKGTAQTAPMVWEAGEYLPVVGQPMMLARTTYEYVTGQSEESDLFQATIGVMHAKVGKVLGAYKRIGQFVAKVEQKYKGSRPSAVDSEKPDGKFVQSEIAMLQKMPGNVAKHGPEANAWKLSRESRADGLAKTKAQPEQQTLEIAHNVGDRAAFERKLRSLQDLADRGKLTKTQTVRDTTVTRDYRKDLLDRAKKDWKQADPERYRNMQIRIKNMDADHLHELQLGGIDHRSALTMLDKPVNRSFGAQIRPQLAKMPEGTPISQVVEKAGKK